ncbi:MAG: pyridoxamine 5'-phosphate oxidase family protein [Alkalispirochaeta sp.]
MELNALLDVMERVLDGSGAAVLTTVDSQGRPHSRWMVPAILRGQTGSLYAVTSPHFAKIEHIAAQPRVSWLLQSKSLDETVEVTGKAQVIDNPALKSDVLEALGSKLSAFWHVNPDETDLTVIETAIESITYLQTATGERVSATV